MRNLLKNLRGFWKETGTFDEDKEVVEGDEVLELLMMMTEGGGGLGVGLSFLITIVTGLLRRRREKEGLAACQPLRVRGKTSASPARLDRF